MGVSPPAPGFLLGGGSVVGGFHSPPPPLFDFFWKVPSTLGFCSPLPHLKNPKYTPAALHTQRIDFFSPPIVLLNENLITGVEGMAKGIPT